VVSVDTILNEPLVEPDYNSADDWDHIVIDNNFQTGFYTTLDFVLRKSKPKDRFNVLAIVVNPTEPCNEISLKDFEFVGYDLLDKEYGTSPLTNCGGLNESFFPSDLNSFGLIDSYEKAYTIRQALFEKNPEEHHADTNVIAVWRHKVLGRGNTTFKIID
jgi:hypothetical protein